MIIVVLGAILIWPPMQEVVRMGSRENLAVLHIMRENIMTDLRESIMTDLRESIMTDLRESIKTDLR